MSLSFITTVKQLFSQLSTPIRHHGTPYFGLLRRRSPTSPAFYDSQEVDIPRAALSMKERSHCSYIN